jgi:cytochrome c oxidase subunit 2
VFMQRTCVMCHTISGTPAGSRLGPELTHIATRPSLAAGVLSNTRENMARWIRNPQLIKPGVRMPPNPLSNADLNALLDYLETLR